MGKYRGIDHPSVAETVCPYCGAGKGVPCRKSREYSTGGRQKQPDHSNYCQTHKMRADRYEKKLKESQEL